MSRLGPGALVWSSFDGPEVPGPLLDAIAAGTIGGLIVFSARGNARSREQVRAMLADVAAAAQRGGVPPVPVAVDQEGGGVIRIAYRAAFPSAMAIAATGDPAYAERVARATAEGLRADGITVDHAPVCDVNVEPRNPVIGTRSFGDDAERVAAFAAAWVRGSQAAGVASTPKHFPGHGAARHDTHITTVDVRADRATLMSRELVPFRAAIAAGASGVMAAHVRYPAIDEDDIATFSPKVLRGLLRDELGYTGPILTDALDMAGVTHMETPERIVPRAIAAGIDCALLVGPIERALAAAEEIALGVPAPRVLEAIGQAAKLRDRFGSMGPREDIDDSAARALAREVAERAITHVGPPLPLVEGGLRVSVFPLAHSSLAETPYDRTEDLIAALRRRFGDRAHIERDGRVPEGEGPLVVCTASAWFDDDQAARARALLANDGVLCAMRSPYDAALVPGRPALLSYSDVPASLEALVAVLAEDRPARGHLPVRLP
ncbi:MAG: glycoside hydrolase family 3 protein [Chloroflexi bacterium]|nr:glycoside hydrolase family 3 protein [Chloroflexota bacterium]